MVADRLGALGELRTLDEMTAAFADEDRCRDVLEALSGPTAPSAHSAAAGTVGGAADRTTPRAAGAVAKAHAGHRSP